MLAGFGILQLVYVLPFLAVTLYARRPRIAGTIVVLSVLTFEASALLWLMIAAGGNLVP